MENYEIGNMFTVMPMSQRINLEPGQVYEGSINVVNPADSKEDFHYRISVTPYNVTDDDYAVDLATISDRSEIIKWIEVENPTGSVAPNGIAKVNFKITVPEDAPGGGQYATISVGSDAKGIENDGVSVKNIFEMASIIYADVDGEIRHEGQILENKIPAFSTTAPVSVAARFSNTGNVHEDATIIIKATNFFTGEVILPTEQNEGKYSEVVMPETERSVTREIENLPLVGVVHIEQSIFYLGTSSTEAKNVIICPIWFMLLVLLTIGAIAGAITHLIIKHRKRKRLV